MPRQTTPLTIRRRVQLLRVVLGCLIRAERQGRSWVLYHNHPIRGRRYGLASVGQSLQRGLDIPPRSTWQDGIRELRGCGKRYRRKVRGARS